LSAIKARTGLPILTDIHEAAQAAPVAEVADILQIPAFLCRQTDLLVAAARTGRVVNVKKGQFLAPRDMRHVVGKLASRRHGRPADRARHFVRLQQPGRGHARAADAARAGHPVVFDVTHSLQLPGAGDGVTAGLGEYIEPLARAGVAAGVDGVFMEVHENPSQARSDAANALKLDRSSRCCAARGH
jgi:2-dehydro-3-deoxyphosphooctonate aldolase (KDO 8-P synthase)